MMIMMLYIVSMMRWIQQDDEQDRYNNICSSLQFTTLLIRSMNWLINSLDGIWPLASSSIFLVFHSRRCTTMHDPHFNFSSLFQTILVLTLNRIHSIATSTITFMSQGMHGCDLLLQYFDNTQSIYRIQDPTTGCCKTSPRAFYSINASILVILMLNFFTIHLRQ